MITGIVLGLLIALGGAIVWSVSSSQGDGPDGCALGCGMVLLYAICIAVLLWFIKHHVKFV